MLEMERSVFYSLDHCIWLIDTNTQTPQAYANFHLCHVMVYSCNWELVYEEW